MGVKIKSQRGMITSIPFTSFLYFLEVKLRRTFHRQIWKIRLWGCKAHKTVNNSPCPRSCVIFLLLLCLKSWGCLESLRLSKSKNVIWSLSAFFGWGIKTTWKPFCWTSATKWGGEYCFHIQNMRGVWRFKLGRLLVKTISFHCLIGFQLFEGSLYWC